MSGGRGDGGNVSNIKKVVEGMTQVQQAPSTLLTRRFVKYLSSSELVDSTYAACLERYKEEQSTDVLLCVTLLIRQYLSLHPPSVVMLHNILTFVRDLMKHDSNSYAGRSLMHLENAIIAHSDTLKGTELTTWKQLMDDSTPTTPAPPGLGTISRTSSKGSFHSSMSVVSHTTPRAHRKRRSVSNAPPIAGPGWKAASIEYEGFADISSIAGHQWKPFVKNRYKGQADIVPYESLISYDKGAPSPTNKQHPKPPGGPQLFQYHYYKEQVPLELPKSEMDKMLATLTSVPGSISGMGPTHSEVELAEKLLIKVLCDSYASHLKGAMSSVRLTTLLALSLLKDLAASPYICVRKTAFNIVLNLSIHINLLEDQHFFSESYQPKSNNILTVHNELVWLLHELILHIVQWDEEDDSVWHNAMVCWLVLTGDPVTGFPNEKALSDIDVRALKRFTEVPKVTEDEAVLGSVVKMLYTALVVDGKLDSVKMDLLGGWRAIVDLMLTVHSWGARTYCFNLIYLHVSEQMMAQNDLRGIVPPEQERAVLDNVLSEFLRTDLHWCLPAVFKYPTDFHLPLLQYLTSEGPIREGYNRGVAQHVLQHIQGLALEYARLPKVIREDIKNIFESDDKMFLSMKQLSTLAQSNSECRAANIENRALAARWLFTLTKHSVEAQQQQSAALKTHVEAILSELTHDRIYNIRLLFLSVTESYLLLLKSREPDHTTVIDSLNKSLMVMVKRGESHLQVLLKMFHLVVEFVTVLAREPKGVHAQRDSVADMLVMGCLEVPHTLLMRIKTELLLYIFSELKGYSANGACTARHATLLLIISQVTYDKSLLSLVGGKSFFTALLSGSSQRLSLAAALFLISYCSTSEPKLWHEATKNISPGSKIEHPLVLANHLMKHSPK
eukprot:TRINITY_DN19948_c0_g1_i1.p1 TRINITY_DN19948_c0_g1~~TRINITY_DN19948_c0_g1_i1.p1  ORF type:complete len:898 (+),score=221.47 TRINITY_DN19948_c0_g1_i1:29-2722(+)